MFRFATRQDPVTGARVVDVARVIDAIRAVGLVVVIITVSLASPRPGTDEPRGIAIAVTLGLSAAAWIVWMLAGHQALDDGREPGRDGGGGRRAGRAVAEQPGRRHRLRRGVQRGRPAAGPRRRWASWRRPWPRSWSRGWSPGRRPECCWATPFAFAGLWSVALTRREFLVRAEQAEHTLAETRRAREAETQAAALAERARIARDIHDVLAHSLAAVSVNLQAAEGLLAADTLPADNPELAKAIECIDRAGTLTREGLAAARRAVLALRDDAAPLPDQLSSLAAQYRAVGDLAVDFAVTGPPRPLSEQASLVAYRTAQEALTNARKHAPGQPVALSLGFEAAQITVSVVNPLPPGDDHRPARRRWAPGPA